MKHYTLSEAYFIRQREIVIRVSESSPEEIPGHFTLGRNVQPDKQKRGRPDDGMGEPLWSKSSPLPGLLSSNWGYPALREAIPL